MTAVCRNLMLMFWIDIEIKLCPKDLNIGMWHVCVWKGISSEAEGDCVKVLCMASNFV